MADSLSNPTIKNTPLAGAPGLLLGVSDDPSSSTYREVHAIDCYEAGYTEAATWDELVTLQTAGTPSLVCSQLTVGASVTLSGAPIKFTPTGSLDLNGFTLVLDSAVINPDNHQLFTNFSPGDVYGAFGSNYTRNPDWFGADSGFGNDPSVLFATEFAAADDSAPGIQAAINSFPIKNLSSRPINGRVILAGTYKIASGILIPDYCHLEGVSTRGAICYVDPDGFLSGDSVITMGQSASSWSFDTRISNVWLSLRSTAKEIGAINWALAAGEGSLMSNIRISDFTGANGAILNVDTNASLGTSFDNITFENTLNTPATNVAAINITGGPHNIDIRHVTTNSTVGRYTDGVKTTNAYGVTLSHTNFEDCVDGIHCLQTGSALSMVTISNLLASTASGGVNSTDHLVHLEDATTGGRYDITNLVCQVALGTAIILDDGATSGAGVGPSFAHFKYQRSGATTVVNQV